MTIEKKIAKTIKRLLLIVFISALSLGLTKVLLFFAYGENEGVHSETIDSVFIGICLFACIIAITYYPILWVFMKAQD